RADRLPLYGYSRNTVPFITAEREKWLVFERAYSHASATATTFPILFNSQYFAAITGSNEGSKATWRFLHDHGVRSAFMSAGAMEWGGITHALDVEHMDRAFIATDLNRQEEWRTRDRRFDFAIEDSVPLH